MTIERRRAPREPLIASVEVIDLQTNARLKARTLDASLVGCYLDVANPFPVGTEVSVRISNENAIFTALGSIAHCEENLGMGIRFTDVQLDQNEILDGWLATLVR
jgi:PilZ domain